MRGSGALVAASVMAASAAALTSSSSSGNINQAFSSSGKKGMPSKCTSSDKEKFAPRFDGLRFIETLVTAHR